MKGKRIISLIIMFSIMKVFFMCYTAYGALTALRVPALTVVSVTPLNLKQVQIVFNKAVDKISAETIENYCQDLREIPIGAAKAELQVDGKTVILTFATAKAQGTAVTYTVYGVKNYDLTEVIASVAIPLPDVVYTLVVTNVEDSAGNVIVTSSKSVVITDSHCQTVISAAIVDIAYTQVEVVFSKSMDYTSIVTLSNYQYNSAALPLGTTVTPTANNTSVLITFPSTIISGVDITTINLQDTAGNYELGTSTDLGGYVPTIPPVLKMGDLNGDNEIKLDDIIIMKDYLLGKVLENPSVILSNGDMDGDGKITSRDYVLLLRIEQQNQ
jgi:hypothetical protein